MKTVKTKKDLLLAKKERVVKLILVQKKTKTNLVHVKNKNYI